MRNALTAVALCGGLLAPATLVAQGQDWSALVVGQPSEDTGTAFADAFHVHAALRSAGLSDARLLRDGGAGAVRAALAEAGGPLLVYLAVPLFDGPNGPVLFTDTGAEALPLAEIAGHEGDLAVLIETCFGAAPLLDVTAPDRTALFLAASHAPGTDCAQDGRLTDRLTADGAADSLQDLLADAWIGANTAAPIPLTPPSRNAGPSPILGLVDASAPAVAVVGRDIVSITRTLPPVDTTPVLVSAANPVRSEGTPRPATVVFVEPALEQIAAQPTRAGLPEPSIIIGLIAPTDASFDTIDPTGPEVSSNEIAFDNLDARRALRDQDAELFETLVANGAFDPPEDLLEVALQTEMARMGCYRAGIDGDWGPGSRGSVTEYFDQIEGVSATTLEPTIELFRQIMLQDDVNCPAPVAAAPAPSTATAAAPRASAPAPRASAPAAPRAQPTPAPAPAPSLRNNLSTGVLR